MMMAIRSNKHCKINRFGTVSLLWPHWWTVHNGWNGDNGMSNTWKPCVCYTCYHFKYSSPAVTTSLFSPVKVPPTSCEWQVTVSLLTRKISWWHRGHFSVKHIFCNSKHFSIELGEDFAVLKLIPWNYSSSWSWKTMFCNSMYFAKGNAVFACSSNIPKSLGISPVLGIFYTPWLSTFYLIVRSQRWYCKTICIVQYAFYLVLVV